jgi:hypothetical protein
MQKRMGAQGRGVCRALGAGNRARLALPLLAALFVLLGGARAEASFHLIKVREVFPGTTARPDSDYVELQMYSFGQNLVHFGELEVLGPTGTATDSFFPPSNVAASANQSTVLIADSEFSAQFPSVTPDFTDTGLNLSPGGGAVCWPQTEPPFDDCVSWGNFSGQASLPEPGDSAPAAAAGIPNGMALVRSIAPGCATLLENADDTDNSSVDFAAATPAPRGNTTAPTEHECAALPNTAIDAKPATPTKETSASFTYHSLPAGAEFECRLDAAAFADCEATGVAYPGPLSPGSHSFEVRAVSEAGADSTPAAYTWAIDTTPPLAEIKTHPNDPSPGNSAAFTYASTEAGSTFKCSLERAGEADGFSSCPSTGKTYPDAGHPAPLANGEWTFKVLATDKAGNESIAAAEFSWEVDNSQIDETPPDTTIESRPPDPSTSPSASFTYASTEPNSSFECQLDGGGFTSCPIAGVTYANLGSGPHAFQVRAIDASDNIDQTPAGYSFQVVLSGLPSIGPVALPSLPPLQLPGARSNPGPKPETTISGKAEFKTHDRTPTFRFSSGNPRAKFECKLDGSPFRACRSPLTTSKLSFGTHRLRVRASVAGVPDPTPAKLTFKVVKS